MALGLMTAIAFTIYIIIKEIYELNVNVVRHYFRHKIMGCQN
jgi:hypothetical protein